MNEQQIADLGEEEGGMVILDGMSYYFGRHRDSLKEELRKIEGVPNATYLVKGGQVFVFSKLVDLVEERQKLEPGLALADLAPGLIAEATVSAKDAVESWGITPEPYEIAEDSTTGLMIQHRAFNARLPGTFVTKSAAQEALACLLLGEILPGNGDFTYHGQSMTLCDPLDTSLLPPRPAIRSMDNPESLGYTALGNVAYESGFEPISNAMFEKAKKLEAAWMNDSAQASQYAQENATDIWARTTNFQLETLNDRSDEVPKCGQEDLAELRSLYPELHMLSDATLYAKFDDYQSDCCYINVWTANRDDEFLFYLISQVASRQNEEDTAKQIGYWLAYALLQGDALSDAIAFGAAANLYDTAISRLAQRIANAMRFLTEDKKSTELKGQGISTMMDVFRLARKSNIAPVLA